MSYFGLSILLWCSVGFIVGIKQIYADKKFTKEFNDLVEEELAGDISALYWAKLMQKKSVFLAITSILGFVAFYLDTISTFQKE